MPAQVIGPLISAGFPIECAHIVSLGSNCRTTYNLRRHYDFSKGYPFDWWVTPIDGLALALQDIQAGDLSWFYRQDCLEEVVKNGIRQTVRQLRYNCTLPHDFPHDSKGIAHDWRLHLARPISRVTKLASDLTSLTGRVAFVYNHSEVKVGGTEQWEAVLVERVEAMFDDFVLVLIGGESAYEHEKVIRLRFDDAPTDDWRGDPDVWSDALSALPVRLVNEDRSRFVFSARPIAMDMQSPH